jgi:Xaa-Pro aminopeptidase
MNPKQSTAQHVKALRELLAERNLDAFLVPSEDAHGSEYVSECFQRRAFITGFTGSAGTALITRERAFLYTDGRYFVQAERELDPTVWELKKHLVDPPLEEFAGTVLSPGSHIGFDPETLSISGFSKLRNALTTHGIRLVPVSANNGHSVEESVHCNLVDKVWGAARPPMPRSMVFPHPVGFAGETATSKVQRVVAEMAKNNSDWLVVCALDEITWLLNLRGHDIEYNPVFLAYVLIRRKAAAPSTTPETAEPIGDVYLYTAEERLEPAAIDALLELGVHLRPYEVIAADVDTMIGVNDRVWYDPSRTNCLIGQRLRLAEFQDADRDPTKPSAGASRQSVLAKATPIGLFKARKNEAELAGMRSAHVRDAVALCRFLAKLEHKLKVEHASIDEYEAAQLVDSFRAQQENFVSPSFPTISSAGPNAAVIHYRPDAERARQVTLAEIYLVDSGGQYLDGTTDVTRTVHFGAPSARERECFTRVLKGYIQLEKALFPPGTTGQQLDILARLPLWNIGRDYRHGTGHGVGCFLNVHEGPQMISPRASAGETPLEAGMTITNEPGYYEDGHFGMRFENVLLVVPKLAADECMGSKAYLGFENITLVPVDRNLLDRRLLTADEIHWIDAYHERVLGKLAPLVAEDPTTMQWLQEQCRPLDVE